MNLVDTIFIDEGDLKKIDEALRLNGSYSHKNTIGRGAMVYDILKWKLEKSGYSMDRIPQLRPRRVEISMPSDGWRVLEEMSSRKNGGLTTMFFHLTRKEYYPAFIANLMFDPSTVIRIDTSMLVKEIRNEKEMLNQKLELKI